ncbi:MAG: hypothetical protein LBJ67_05070 [Planctomycetaceae bacterium]|jgi:hypothetical protein|nr:hypothetical protein [Planctomycetaceae bacterium]
MNKKVTRRVVLGTVTAGLAAGPFVMWYFRQGASKLSYYTPFEIDVKKIQTYTDLSEKDIRRAYEIFFSERQKWEKFKGFKADVKITTEIKEASNDKKVFDCQGFLSFKLKNLGLNGENFSCKLDYSDNQSRWSLEMSENKQNFQGDKTQLRVEPTLLPTMFTLPQMSLLSLTNQFLTQREGAWIPFSYSSEQDSYLFKSIKKNIYDEEVLFSNGHFKSCTLAGGGFVYDDYIEVTHQFDFPSKIVFSVDKDGINRNCTTDFKNIKLI